MKLKLTKRDVLFFVIGFMSLFAISVAWDWDAHVQAFKEGYNSTSESPNPDATQEK